MEFMRSTNNLVPNLHYIVAIAYMDRQAYGEVEAMASRVGGTCWIISENIIQTIEGPAYIYYGYIETEMSDITPDKLNTYAEATFTGVSQNPVDAQTEVLFDSSDLLIGTSSSPSVRWMAPDSLLNPNSIYAVGISWEPKNPPSLQEIDKALKLNGMKLTTQLFSKTVGKNLIILVSTQEMSPTPASLAQALGASWVFVNPEPFASGALATVFIEAEKITGVLGKTVDGIVNTVSTIVDILPNDPDAPGFNWLQIAAVSGLGLALLYGGVKYYKALKG